MKIGITRKIDKPKKDLNENIGIADIDKIKKK